MTSNLTAAARMAFQALQICFITIAPILACMPAQGELGGNVSSIQADQEHMKGTRRVTSNAAYSVHEIQASTGTVVREYVSPSGTVFGVAWRGPWNPDLQQILGQYFNQYAQAIQNKRAGRGPVSVRQEGLVVEAGGHMRSFFGRAYLPQMLPQGITSDVIK